MKPSVERKSMTHQAMHGTGLTMYSRELLQRARTYIRIPSQDSGATIPTRTARRPANGFAMMRTDTW